MVMRDHINLTGRSPLIGRNADELGPRFPDLTDAWSPRLRERLHAAAAAEGIALAEGIYVGLTGPTYETPAEVRMLAALGGHAVGMSTVLECIAARWVGLEVCGVSLVTNAGAGYSGEPLTHEEVLAAGADRGAAPGAGHRPVRRGAAAGLTSGRCRAQARLTNKVPDGPSVRDLRHSVEVGGRHTLARSPARVGRPTTPIWRCDMTRVLVVHHDLDLAGQEVDSLRRFGLRRRRMRGPDPQPLSGPRRSRLRSGRTSRRPGL